MGLTDNPYVNVMIQVGIGELERQGKKLIKKDVNKTGKDDAAGLAMVAAASGMRELDFTDISKTSLTEMGDALIAVGEKVKEAAEVV